MCTPFIKEERVKEQKRLLKATRYNILEKDKEPEEEGRVITPPNPALGPDCIEGDEKKSLHIYNL